MQTYFCFREVSHVEIDFIVRNNITMIRANQMRKRAGENKFGFGAAVKVIESVIFAGMYVYCVVIASPRTAKQLKERT
jgi:hypothetical protein